MPQLFKFSSPFFSFFQFFLWLSIEKVNAQAEKRFVSKRTILQADFAGCAFPFSIVPFFIYCFLQNDPVLARFENNHW